MKSFDMEKAPRNPSLRRQLLVNLSVFSVLLFILLGYSAYKIALEETEEILDQKMKEMAYFLAETSINHLDSAFKPNHRYDETDTFIDIWTDQGNPQLHRLEDHDHIRLAKMQEPGFHQVNSSIGELKVFVVPLSNKQIQISQLMSVRRNLAGELALNMLIPYVVLIPLVLIGLGLLIRKHFKPLTNLQYHIANRSHDDLTPISTIALPLEVSPTIEELNRLFERIDDAQKQQQQFIADAAHELRSPITALNLQIKVLQTTLPTLMEDKHFLNLRNGLYRIQHLVTQLMTLAHQDALLPSEFERVDMAEQVKQTIKQLMYQARKKHIDLGLNQQVEDCRLQVRATPAKIQSILFNLIDNAIKYTPEHGSIDVEIYQQQGYVCLYVEDSGAGVAPADYAKLTQRFVRLDNDQDVLGSGLGLAIVQTVIEQLGGMLKFAQSTRLGGLSVTITLPVVD